MISVYCVLGSQFPGKLEFMKYCKGQHHPIGNYLCQYEQSSKNHEHFFSFDLICYLYKATNDSRRDKKLIAIRFEMVHFWMIFFFIYIQLIDG